MEEEKKQEKSMDEKLCEKVDEKIKIILEQGIQAGNIDMLSKMVDIKKDVAKMKKEEKEMRYMMGSYNDGRGGNYGEYDNYSGGRRRDSRGRYMEGESSYGRRGVKGTGRGRYRGEEMMDEMAYHYGNYSEDSSYGAEGEAMEALSNLMESAYEYFKELKENANSQEEIKMMEHYFKKMGQM